MTSSSQSQHQPDALEEARRQRGEGWEWHRIQFDACPQCGYHPAAQPPASLGAAVVEEAAAWRRFLDQSDDGFLRTNPGPVIFSPMQYGAHVRDMLRVAGDRMIRGRDEDNPVVPIFNPPEETFLSYNQLDRGELAAEMEGQAQRLAGIIDGMDPSAWSRTVTNDRGRYGVYSFTLAGLACNAAHEAHHHLLDANGTLPASSAS